MKNEATFVQVLLQHPLIHWYFEKEFFINIKSDIQLMN
jgi:hypothetical protein